MLVGGAGRGAFASGGLPALYDWMTVLWVSLIPLALALATLAASTLARGGPDSLSRGRAIPRFQQQESP